MGIIYVATGNEFVGLALQSIEYLRKVEPDVPVIVFCGRGDLSNLSANSQKLGFDLRVLDPPTGSLRDKAGAIAQSPFEKTVYLDADTVPIRPFIEAINRALDSVDLVATGGHRLKVAWESEALSPALGQFNTGVIGLRSDAAEPFIKFWLADMRKRPPGESDQTSFRLAAFRTGIRTGCLTEDFNFTGHGAVVAPRILHFKGAARNKPYFTNARARRRLIESFTRESVNDFFSDFAPAYSLHNVRSSRGPGQISWWLKGVARWFYVRIWDFGFRLGSGSR